MASNARSPSPRLGHSAPTLSATLQPAIEAPAYSGCGRKTPRAVPPANQRYQPVYRTSPFSRFATWTARASGHPSSFALAATVIVAWLVTGPLFAFSDTWQLVINTGTTIVTFLMVFLIQNTQNRDGAAVQLKLDEIIRAIEGAHNELLDLEELSEPELAKFRRRYEALARRARQDMKGGVDATGTPEVADS